MIACIPMVLSSPPLSLISVNGKRTWLAYLFPPSPPPLSFYLTDYNDIIIIIIIQINKKKSKEKRTNTCGGWEQFHGKGVLTFPGGKYEGQWVHDRKEGEGVFVDFSWRYLHRLLEG